jgi:hypothetical protein
MPNRQPLHTNPELCSYALGVLNSSVPLEIRASSVCDGSGLFLSEVSGIDANCEIYRTPLSLAAIDPGVKTVCHGCLREEEELFPDVSNPGTKLKACGACKATYYCSKVRSETKSAIVSILTRRTAMPEGFVDSVSQTGVQNYSAGSKYALVDAAGVTLGPVC